MNKSWGSKFPGNILRLAGIIHVFSKDIGSTVIDLETAGHAFSLYYWLMDHALVAFQIMQNSMDYKAALALVSFVQASGSQKLSFREMHQHFRGQAFFKKADDFRPVVELLVEKGYCRPVPEKNNQAGRKSEIYEFNPALF